MCAGGKNSTDIDLIKYDATNGWTITTSNSPQYLTNREFFSLSNAYNFESDLILIVFGGKINNIYNSVCYYYNLLNGTWSNITRESLALTDCSAIVKSYDGADYVVVSTG